MTLPDPALLFARFEQDAGTKGGARQYFQMLVTDLVKIQSPLATTVEGPGGRDWGIDTFVGSFNGGLFVWQSKFVLEWDDATRQGQVRSSFNQIITEAAKHRFTVRAWTLCVPCDLSPDQQKWFDGWAGRMRRQHGVRVRLWNGTELRHQLIREDARHVRAEYFPHTVATTSQTITEHPLAPFATTDDHAQFDDALFVRQLQAAGHEETDAARGLFYATEALFRDYTAKGDGESLVALEELHLDVHSIWENNFNAEFVRADRHGRMPQLIGLVMEQAAARPDPGNLRLRPVHKKGAAHRLVEAERAGWVTQWRQVAAQHRAEPAVASSETTPVIEKAKAGTKSEMTMDPGRNRPGHEPEVLMETAATTTPLPVSPDAGDRPADLANAQGKNGEEEGHDG